MSHRRIATLWSLWGCCVVLALALSAANVSPDEGPARVPGRLIVKYKGNVTECAGCLINERKSFRTATTDRSDSLDTLHAKYHVKSAKALFRSESDEARLPHKTLTAMRQMEEQRRAKAAKRFGARAKRAAALAVQPDLANVYILTVPENTDLDAAAAALAADPHVEYAQADVMFSAAVAPNDPYYGSAGAWGQSSDDLWGLNAIHAEGGWLLSKGGGVLVAVVDSGVDYTHEDLAGRVWINTAEVPANGLDDDANGFVDDVRGWDFTACARFSTSGACVTAKPQDNDPVDGFGHGTHVAGTIAAAGDNGLGVIGIAPEALLMPVQALNNGGSGSSSWVASAIRYAADNGADVINISLACSVACPSVPVVEDAVRYATGLGTVIILAAGNTNADVALRSPQNMPETIVVSAIGPDGQKLSFSNFGAKIDVAAPGGGPEALPGVYMPTYSILSLRAVGALIDPGLIVGGQYVRGAGTSMAAPHVSGVAALILSRRPEFTVEDVRQALHLSADDVGAAGVDPQTGHGRVNAARAVALPSVNAPPVFGAIGVLTAAEGFPFALTLPGSDADGDPLTFSASGMPAGSTLSGAHCAWTPGYDQAGEHQITFTVSDGVAVADAVVLITVLNTNRAPVLTPIDPQTIDVGQTLSLALSAEDPDGDLLTFAVDPLPAGAALTGGAFDWTPTKDQAGDHVLQLSVTDGALTDTHPVTITVVAEQAPPPANQPPTLTLLDPDITNDGKVDVADLRLAVRFFGRPSPYDVTGDGRINSGDLALIAGAQGFNWPPTNVTQGRKVVVFMVGEDPDHQPLTLSANGLPAGAMFRQPYPNKPNLWQFIFRPAHAQRGNYQVTFTATDGTDTASASLPIRVMKSHHH